MRIARGLSIDDTDDSGVRVRAADWPWAGLVALPALAAGVPLVFWSAATLHWIELGGGAVFCAFGATCMWLWLAKRRDVEIRASSVRGREGAGPFGAAVEQRWAGPARLVVEAFDVPAGAPAIDDRGGDLCLVTPDGRLHVARRAGPGWREDLDAARARVVERIPSLR